ncbi:cytochrome P450 [Anaerolineae bacterium CFX9]|nr:cytochrome P450 [Anaerolineae bacterium CFX9]
MAPPASARSIPTPSPQAGLRALRAIAAERSLLSAMRVFHAETGDVFRLNVPGFSPVVLVGPEACRWVLVEQASSLRWRIEKQPITHLLEHGLLVEDGELHDQIKEYLSPALHRKAVDGYALAMVSGTDQIMTGWGRSATLDLLVEVRRMALIILMETLFSVDFSPEMDRLWKAILRLMKYISPGLWLIWSGAPHPGYAAARAQIDRYWEQIIRLRRAEIEREPDLERTDMLSHLILCGAGDDLIRDQLMTMLTAGHDTTTGALAWVFEMLGRHPAVMERLQGEVDRLLGGKLPDFANTDSRHMPYLNAVISETLRLYPPAHLGARLADDDLSFRGYAIPKGTRVLYSIFLTQRHPDYFDDPHRFDPDRVLLRPDRFQPYYFVPFGGGRRTCIGRYFAEVMMRIVVARVFQHFELRSLGRHTHMHMGATIEPRPGVWMAARRR